MPAGALALLAAMFSLPTFVIGPAISGTGSKTNTDRSSGQPTQQAPAKQPRGKDEHGH